MGKKGFKWYQIFLIILVPIFLGFVLYTIHNYDNFHTYLLKSRNSDFEIEGIINITPYYDVLTFHCVRLPLREGYANTKFYRYQTTLMIDDRLVVKKGGDLSQYKSSDLEGEEPILLTDLLENLGDYIIESHDYNEQIKDITEDSKILFIVEYIDTDYHIQTIEIPIVVEKSFSNNKIFYSKGNAI